MSPSRTRPGIARPICILLVALTVAGYVGIGGDAGASGDGRRSARNAAKQDPETIGDLDYQEVVDRTTADLPEFWGEEFPRVFGKPYRVGPRVVAFDSGMTGGEVSACTRGETYEDLGIAFYCNTDDVIAYDDEREFPMLFEEVGAMANALVLAHEWGHAVQFRAMSIPEVRATATVLTETQADCYSGAWAGSVASRPESGLVMSSADLATGLVGLVGFRDPVGLVDPADRDQYSHGSAFDRVSAFQEGFESGVDRCAQWITDPPVIVQTPFTSSLDVARGGNAPYLESIELSTGALDEFWSSKVDGFKSPVVVPFDPDFTASLEPCRSLGLKPSRPDEYRGQVYFCPDDDTIRFDDDLMRRVHVRIGDFAVGVLLAKTWATVLQDRLDLHDGRVATSLHADCLSGAWAGSLPVVLADGSTVAANGGPVTLDFGDMTLSAGDLDEAVELVLRVQDPVRLPGAASKQKSVAAFDRVNAFRLGFEESDTLAACADTLRGVGEPKDGVRRFRTLSDTSRSWR